MQNMKVTTMTYSKSLLFSAAAFFTTASPGLAGELEKWTISGSVGGNYNLETDVSTNSLDSEAEYDIGFAANLVAGRDLFKIGDGVLRAEVDGFYRSAEFDSIEGVVGTDGDLDSYGVLVNLVYEFSDIDWPVKPYIGGGGGWAQVDANFDAPGLVSVDEQDDVGVYQAFVGLRYQVAENIDVFTDFRYLGAINPEFSVSGQIIEVEYESLSASIGFRYRFGG